MLLILGRTPHTQVGKPCVALCNEKSLVCVLFRVCYCVRNRIQPLMPFKMSSCQNDTIHHPDGMLSQHCSAIYACEIYEGNVHSVCRNIIGHNWMPLKRLLLRRSHRPPKNGHHSIKRIPRAAICKTHAICQNYISIFNQRLVTNLLQGLNIISSS